MKSAKKSGAPCKKCGSQNLTTHLTTYPLKIEDRQLNVERVSVRECMDCHYLEPTLQGDKKIMRAMSAFMMLFLGDD
jgi:hypothetical protein